MSQTYCYSFAPEIPTDEIESTLVLALLATESLHGESDVRLDASHAFDAASRNCVIEANTPVGRDLCRLFTGFLRREFGDASFDVHRADVEQATPKKEHTSAA